MKKMLSILIAALLLLGCFGQSKEAAAFMYRSEDEEPEVDEDAVLSPEEMFDLVEIPLDEFEYKTLGDVLALNSPRFSATRTDEQYIYVFEADGFYYRVECPLTPELNERVDALDFLSETYDAQLLEIVGGQPIQRVVDLTPGILEQEELDAFVGMTGGDLLDNGFRFASGYSFDGEPEVYLANGMYEYQFTFAEKVPARDDYDEALEEIVRPLTVKKASFFQLTSEASDPDYGVSFWGNDEEEAEAVSVTLEEIPLAESPFKTLGDVFAGDPQQYQSASAADKYVIAFGKDGRYYRVEAAIPPEVSAKLQAIDFMDETRVEKEQALLSALPVTRVGDLSESLPSQAELDMLIGMTGEDLLDMGFTVGTGYSFNEKAMAYMELDLYEYQVFFNETVPPQEDYDEVLDELLKPLTIRKIQFFQLTPLCADPYLVY